ncbi:MAG: GNAT family N-acetyltransferase [Alsobacter sp.]
MTPADLSGLRRATTADLDAVVALQHAAYARNRPILGVEPIPLQADYARVLREWEVWLAEDGEGLAGILIMQARPGDLLIWSIATAPSRQGQGFGGQLLAAAQMRARQLGRDLLRLYTGQKLTANVAWYSRHGFQVERVEAMPDRTAIHMVKAIH